MRAKQDVVSSILQYNAGRDPERLKRKFATLRRDPHAFLRGTCHRYLETLPDNALLSGSPLAWCGGDMHLENFGGYIAGNGHAAFDINDFDEAALAPLLHDPLRLLTDLFVTADDIGLDDTERDAAAELFVAHYADTLFRKQPEALDERSAQGIVRELLARIAAKKDADPLKTRTELKAGRRVLRVDAKKMLAASAAQQAAVKAMLDGFALTQGAPRFFDTLDVARRISGNASLGLPRYVALVRGSGAAGGEALLDLKQSSPSVLATALSLPQPPWGSEAERIVALQWRMQAAPPSLLQVVPAQPQAGTAAFVLRALQPAQDRIELADCRGKPRRLATLLQATAQTMASAQLRGAGWQGAATGDALARFIASNAWRAPLKALAAQCAVQVKADWAEYSRAYDKGLVQP